MDDTTRPQDQQLDDVEGHALRSGRLLGDEPDDVEGHAKTGR